MKIPTDGTRINVTTAATLFSMDPSHFRRLVRRGVLPKAKRTSRNMPYYDRKLMERIQHVLRSGVGCNGDEIAFYRRRPKTQRLPSLRRNKGDATNAPTAFVESVLEGCRQLGVEGDYLSPARISRTLAEEFGSNYEERALEEVIPVLVRRLQDKQ